MKQFLAVATIIYASSGKNGNVCEARTLFDVWDSKNAGRKSKKTCTTTLKIKNRALQAKLGTKTPLSQSLFFIGVVVR